MSFSDDAPPEDAPDETGLQEKQAALPAAARTDQLILSKTDLQAMETRNREDARATEDRLRAGMEAMGFSLHREFEGQMMAARAMVDDRRSEDVRMGARLEGLIKSGLRTQRRATLFYVLLGQSLTAALCLAVIGWLHWM